MFIHDQHSPNFQTTGVQVHGLQERKTKRSRLTSVHIKQVNVRVCNCTSFLGNSKWVPIQKDSMPLDDAFDIADPSSMQESHT